MKNKFLQSFFRILAFASALNATPAYAQVYPLSENNWGNPDFVNRFMGSYGVDTEKNPGITVAEKTLFDSVAAVIGSNPSEAARMLSAGITTESSAALDYTLGNLYFQLGRNDDAIIAYQKAIRKFPNFLRAYKNLGILKIQSAKFEEALPFLLKAVELGGADGDLYGLIAYSHLNLGRSAQALPAYRMARMFAPLSRDWAIGEIQCLMNMSAFDEAIGHIDELLVRFPDDPTLFLLQANAFVGRNELSKAVANLEIVRAMGKETLASLGLLADIYMNMNQPTLALPIYLDTLAKEDLDKSRAFRIAHVLSRVEAWEETTDYLKAFEVKFADKLTEEETLNLLNLKAKVALATGHEDQAMEYLDQVVKRDPLNGGALLLIADFHWRQHSFEEAKLNFERAAKVNETRVDALIQHARMRVAMREFPAAARLLQQAQMLEPRNYVAEYLTKVEAAARASAF